MKDHSPIAPDDRGDPAPTRCVLGMPHLGPRGVCANWLLRQSGHLHWLAVAAIGGRATCELADIDGARAFPSFVSLRIDGRLEAFAENETVRFVQKRRPARATGWCSETQLLGVGGGRVEVTLASTFARRVGPSNVGLIGAKMPPPYDPVDPAALPAHVRHLRARARAAHAAAKADAAPPVVTLPVLAATDFNGVGLLYFANFLRFFECGEAELLPGAARDLPVTEREVHYFGNADDGDALEVSGCAHVRAIAPAAEAVCETVLRRRSDGVPIAACRTVRGNRDD